MTGRLRDLLDALPDDLRLRALTHPAWAQSHDASYERLEFLGDSVLGLAIAAELTRRFPEHAEGELSRIKNAVVSRRDCVLVAREAGLGEALVDAAADSADPTIVADLAGSDRVLAALVESTIGAAFTVGNYDDVAPVVVAAFAGRIDEALRHREDVKGELQELAQAQGEVVEYRVVETTGVDHDPTFTVEARLSVGGNAATGDGGSKKAAEQAAARALLDALQG